MLCERLSVHLVRCLLLLAWKSKSSFPVFRACLLMIHGTVNTSLVDAALLIHLWILLTLIFAPEIVALSLMFASASTSVTLTPQKRDRMAGFLGVSSLDWWPAANTKYCLDSWEKLPKKSWLVLKASNPVLTFSFSRMSILSVTGASVSCH